MSNKSITRNLKIYVNGKEVTDTITGMRKNLAKLRSQANKEIIGSDKWKKYNKEVANTEIALKKAYDAQKTFKEETKLAEAGISKNTKALSKFTHGLSELYSGFKSGNPIQIRDAFKSIKTSIKGATKAALAFIATPLGAAIAVLVGIAAASKKWFDYNNQVTQALKLTKQLTGLNSQAADAARIRAEVISETFGGEFKDNILQARSLVTQFGISYQKAFDIIEGQLLRGQTNNEEFGQSIKEYSTFFASAKFTAEEFGKVIATGYDLGFYQDKLPDAIKEFDLAIKEQTPATRDALINAFGKPFTDNILKRVRTGKTSTKEALLEISSQADKTGLNLKQNAQLTADLFKGAGEDAGGALKILETLDLALNKEQRTLKKGEKIKQNQINSTKELKAVTAALFRNGSKGFGLLIAKGKLFATRTLIKILKAGINVYNWFVDLNNESGLFSAILTTIGKSATFGFTVIGELISGAWNSFKSLGDIVAGIFTLDWDRIKLGFATGVTGLTDSLERIKQKAIESNLAITDAFNGKNKKERLSINDFTGEETIVDTPSGGSSGNSGLTDEQKAKNEAFKKAEEELTKFILKQKQQRELINKTALEIELAGIDQKYASQIEKAQGHEALLIQLQELRDQEKEDAKLAAAQRLKDRLKAYNEENTLEEEAQRLEKEALGAETDEEKTLLLLARTQYIANEQIRIEEAKELARLKLINASEEEIAAVKKKFSLQKAKVDEIFRKGKEAADKQSVETEKQLNKQRTQEYANMFGNIAQLLGKNTAAGKAAAIAQATINTYQGITEVWTTESTLPEPFATASKIVSTATVLASGLGAVKKITSTETPSFSLGGDTGFGNIGLGSNQGGNIRGVVEDLEYVIPKFVRQDPEVAPVIDYLEAKRTGNYKSFANGGDVSDNNSTTDISGVDYQETQLDNNYLNEILTNLGIGLTRLNEILDIGIIAKLSDDIETSKKIKEGIEDYDALRNENKL